MCPEFLVIRVESHRLCVPNSLSALQLSQWSIEHALRRPSLLSPVFSVSFFVEEAETRHPGLFMDRLPPHPTPPALPGLPKGTAPNCTTRVCVFDIGLIWLRYFRCRGWTTHLSNELFTLMTDADCIRTVHQRVCREMLSAVTCNSTYWEMHHERTQIAGVVVYRIWRVGVFFRILFCFARYGQDGLRVI